MWLIDRIKTYYQVSKVIYPDKKGYRVAKFNWRFVVWCLCSPNVFNTLMNMFKDPRLAPLLQFQQGIKCVEKPFKPYVCKAWTKQQRLDYMIGHLQTVADNFPGLALKCYLLEGYDLFTFSDRDDNKYRINLYHGEGKEGSLGIRILNHLGQRLYTISFNLSANGRDIHIGALQGPAENIENKNEIIKSLTRTLHGLRPKALVLEAILIFARQMNAKNVYGIKTKSHYYFALRYRYFKPNYKEIKVNYEELWAEYNGTSFDEDFYLIPLLKEKKDLSELNRNKRKLYSKRYEWLETYEQEISARLAIEMPATS